MSKDVTFLMIMEFLNNLKKRTGENVNLTEVINDLEFLNLLYREAQQNSPTKGDLNGKGIS
jgi:hypothetical protein